MRVRLLPSTPGGAADRQHLTSFLVEGALAIDAGCLGLHATGPASPGPEHVFLTHAHVDHVGTLPLYLEERHERARGPLRIHGPEGALATLREHYFNDAVWMDYARLREGRAPWVELRPLEPERPLEVDGLRVTGVPVHHTVPTYGYVVEDACAAVAFGADSGPTERLWQVAGATGRLRAAFLECSFPSARDDLARQTGHLTPRLFAGEAAKLPEEAAIIAVHIKPRHREVVVAELMDLGHPRVAIGETGREYVF